MYRPVLKYVVRVVLFASAVVAVACSTPTAPTAVNNKKPSLKDLTDTLECRSGWTIVNGRVVCNPEG